jgi:hypothetical protein
MEKVGREIIWFVVAAPVITIAASDSTHSQPYSYSVRTGEREVADRPSWLFYVCSML